MSKTEKALQRAWAVAAKGGDIYTLASLRLAFEALAPVDVTLTERTVERIQDEYPDPEHPGCFTVLGLSRVVFHDPDAATEAADRIEDGIVEAVRAAEEEQQDDMSDAQLTLLTRSVTDSIKGAAKKLRAAAARKA